MMGKRDFNGRALTEDELETLLQIISEANIEAIIEDSGLIIRAESEDGMVHSLAGCDLRRLAAYSADVTKQLDGDEGVFAIAGLFTKCAQIILNGTKPYYGKRENGAEFSGAVRLFAGNDMETPDEDEE